MDVKIENQDICLSPSARAVMIDGMEQAVQQVNLAVKIPKKSFVYDRNLGVNGEVDFNENGLEKKIEALVNECLLHSDVIVNILSVTKSGDRITIGFTADNGYESCMSEVVLNG